MGHGKVFGRFFWMMDRVEEMLAGGIWFDINWGEK